MKPLELTQSNFEETIQSDKPVLVDFWAQWCGPCKIIGPIVEELANDFSGEAVIAKVDVDKWPDLAAKFSVRSIPTLLIFKNGQIVDKQVGRTTKAILEEKIEEYL